MNYTRRLLIPFFTIIFLGNASAQNNTDARALAKEGVQLNDAKKYTEAIDKYKQALKLDTGYLYADYQLASTLFSADRGKEGIPYLLQVIKTVNPLSGPAYELLGLICFKEKQYTEAEKYAIEAINLDPKRAGTQRMYALVCFHQNKRVPALIGLCSFILLEPNTARSAEAYGNIKNILQGGTLKAEPGSVPVKPDADTYALNQLITQTAADMAKRRYASAADLLAAQLKAVFTNAAALAEKQTGNDFFRKYMAAYFKQLAQSPNMRAFARLISGSTPESIKWIKENARQMADLDTWVKATARDL